MASKMAAKNGFLFKFHLTGALQGLNLTLMQFVLFSDSKVRGTKQLLLKIAITITLLCCKNCKVLHLQLLEHLFTVVGWEYGSLPIGDPKKSRQNQAVRY